MNRATTFNSSLAASIAIAASAAFAQDQHPGVDCEAVLSSEVLDRTEVTQGINIITRLREDICSRDFESASAAKDYARSGGATFNVDSLFDFNINDNKRRTASHYTVSDSKFCSMSSQQIANESSLDFTDVVGQYALRAFESCVEDTSQTGLWITYDVREQVGILTANILRKIAGTSRTGLEINEIEIVVSGDGTNIECRLPGDVIATSGFDTFEVPVEVAGTVSSIPCTKTGSGGAAIIVRTSLSDLGPLEMLSDEEIEARDAEIQQTELEAVASRVAALEAGSADWLTNVRLSSRMIRSDLPGAKVMQRLNCERNEQVTACHSYMMPSGAESCGTDVTDNGRTCFSSGCALPAGQKGYTLRAICTEVLADR